MQRHRSARAWATGLVCFSVSLWATPAWAEGFLYLTTLPSGAQIAVDGAFTAFVTPAQIPLSPGRHTITVMKEGHRVEKRRLSISEGRVTRVALAFSATRSGPRRAAPRATSGLGTLTVVADVLNASVFVDGKATGLLTPTTLSVAAGEHRIRAVHRDRAAEQVVVVSPEKTTVIRVTLAPMAAARPAPSRRAQEQNLADRHRADPTWPARLDECLSGCRQERRKTYEVACEGTYQACIEKCPGTVAGQVVNHGLYYSCEGVCRFDRGTCVAGAVSQCKTDCELRP
jgi:hypothetical protein